MRKYVIGSLIILFVICSISLADAGVTFGDWAVSNGLNGSEVAVYAIDKNITSLQGLANNYPVLGSLNLFQNEISNIQQGDLAGLSNLRNLVLSSNQIEYIEDNSFSGFSSLMELRLNDNLNLNRLNLTGAYMPYLKSFSIAGCPLEQVILANTNLNQALFNALMDGGGGNNGASFTGVAEICGVTEVDFSGVVSYYVDDFSKMYTMDDLVRLIFADATNLPSEGVVALLDELASMSYLDVTGLWDEWYDGGAFSEDQLALMAWDEFEGNTLVVPEPMTVCLLSFGALALLRKRKKG